MVLVAGLVLGGAYLLVEKLLRDRQSAMNFKNPKERFLNDQNSLNTPQTKTYTSQELEEMRKKGQKLPGGMQQVLPQTNSAYNESASQRSLRTIDEINRINEMNQRLMDQQRRLNQQR
jgi:hypothetical protein